MDIGYCLEVLAVEADSYYFALGHVVDFYYCNNDHTVRGEHVVVAYGYCLLLVEVAADLDS